MNAIAACREVGDRSREAWAAGNLAAIRDRAGRPAAAVEAQKQAQAIYTDLAATDPNFRGVLAQTEVFLGMYLTRAVQYDEAITVTRHAIGLYQAIGDRPLTAWANTNLANYRAAADRYHDAVAAQAEARRVYRELAVTTRQVYPG
ncbi:tetratricopeptide repeat protein [Kribbella catacumbae]|uniref:tetratricopeptide repeat protein n=1 Tax=Kribbella catacumbae TaxID=460086 RepID=UPI00037D869D|nr:tetratricopeptide repeat protein [Kribbella catacumbae]